MYKLLRPLCGTLTLALLATTAGAQATIGVSADITAQLTVTGANNLSFGAVLPGFPRTVATSASNAGKFSLSGAVNANVSITLALPADLRSGANILAIDNWDGCRNIADAFAGCTAFTPSGAAFTTPLGPTGVLVVFLGARVVPTAIQPAGLYTGSISMTAAYTGT
jgi:hypothetical protein